MAARSVWKYEVRVVDEFAVQMPEFAEVVHVGVQRGNSDVPYMWALVNPEREVTTRRFYCRGTGHPVNEGLVYLGTFILEGGVFVGHLFEHGLARLGSTS